MRLQELHSTVELQWYDLVGVLVRRMIYASDFVLTFLSIDASPPLFCNGNHGLLAGLSHFHSNVLTGRLSGFALR